MKTATKTRPTDRRGGALALVLIPWVLCAQTARAALPASTTSSVAAPIATSTVAAVTDTAKAQPVEPAFVLRPPKISGFIQVHYRYALETSGDSTHDPNNFRVQRVRIKLKGKVFPWLGYDLSVDPRAPEVTGILRNAFIALRLLPKHEIRIGQQKTQFGFENRISSSDLYVVNRSELSDSLSRGINGRDIGLGIIGKVKLAKHFRVEDALTWVNGAGFNTQDDTTPMKNLWGRVGVRYKDDGLDVALGVSGAIGDQKELGDDLVDPADDFVFDFKRLGADLQIDHPWFFVAAEAVFGNDELPDESVDAFGWYALVAGKTPWEVGPIFRIDNAEGFERYTFGAYYGLPGSLFRILVNYGVRALRDEQRADDKLYAWVQLEL